ncbi:MAG: hypothetical protein H0T63_05225 [Pyrinomonadaceae bacterium]|nr:hypothetical protein [Pyrinomonadaceae bacterium]
MKMKYALKRFVISILAVCVLSAGAFAQRDEKKNPPKEERVIQKKEKDREQKKEERRDNQDNQKNDNRKKPDG